MNWLEITISVRDEAIEAASAILLEAGAKGVAIDDPFALTKVENQKGSWDYVEAKPPVDPDAEAQVRGWFQDSEKFPALFEEIKAQAALLNSYGLDAGSSRVRVFQVEDENWATAWQQYYKPFRLGKSLVIRPHWEDFVLEQNDLEIVLDPGLAFGTGMHPTTKLCLQALEEYLPRGASFLDIGCGSGILTIAASKLGAGNLIAVDNDPLAIASARQNLKLNGLTGKVNLIEGNLADQVKEPVDLIVANIVADAILSLLAQVRELLLPQGIFISGGIINSCKEELVLMITVESLAFLEIIEEGEWVSIIAQKE